MIWYWLTFSDIGIPIMAFRYVQCVLTRKIARVNRLPAHKLTSVAPKWTSVANKNLSNRSREYKCFLIMDI